MHVRFVRPALGFLILFALYQSAEGVGQRLLGSFAVQAGLMLLCLGAAWPVGRFLLGYRGFDAYALEWRPAVVLWLVGGVLFAGLTKVLAVLIGANFGAYALGPAAAAPGFVSLVPVVALALVSTFIPSIVEDIITRGFWWRVPGDALRGAVFVLATSTIYVLNHVYRLGNGPMEWMMLFCFGVAYAVAVVRTGSLWAAVGVHWGWNLTNALLGIFVTVETTSGAGPIISSVAHLSMAAVILLCPKTLWPGANRATARRTPSHSS